MPGVASRAAARIDIGKALHSGCVLGDIGPGHQLERLRLQLRRDGPGLFPAVQRHLLPRRDRSALRSPWPDRPGHNARCTSALLHANGCLKQKWPVGLSTFIAFLWIVFSMVISAFCTQLTPCFFLLHRRPHLHRTRVGGCVGVWVCVFVCVCMCV